MPHGWRAAIRHGAEALRCKALAAAADGRDEDERALKRGAAVLGTLGEHVECLQSEAQLRAAIIRWFGGGEVGLSSTAMALAIAGLPGPRNHPWDPDDLNRCLKLLQCVPAGRTRLGSVAALSPTWTRLVARWDELEASYVAEVGPDMSKGGRAARTYELMCEILRPAAARNRSRRAEADASR